MIMAPWQDKMRVQVQMQFAMLDFPRVKFVNVVVQ